MASQVITLLYPIRNYRNRGWASRPADLGRWKLQYCEAPYHDLEPVWNEKDVLAPLPANSQPPRGPILLAESEDLNPNHEFVEVEGLLSSPPWLALIVVVPHPTQTDPLKRRITHLGRCGAVAVPRRIVSARELACAARKPLDPPPDLGLWLGRAIPGWPAAKRATTVEAFNNGFRYDREECVSMRPGARFPSRRKSWTQVGRASRATPASRRRMVDRGAVWR